MDWSMHAPIRLTVEKYYLSNSAAGNIDIPKFDQFVTQIREDWETAGFDLASEADVFKLWGVLQVTCTAMAAMRSECESREEAGGALKVAGLYGNMTGLFLREMSKSVPGIPAVVLDA